MSQENNKPYSLEFKISSAKLAVESGLISQTARELGVKPTTMHGWIKKYINTEKEIAPSTVSSEVKLHEELKHLRKEVARLRQERDILKKATAYFAVETL